MWDKAEWENWRILLKLDPDKILPEIALTDVLKHPAIDALIIGGTQNITKENTDQLVRLIRTEGIEKPLIQELTDLQAVSLDVDAYYMPVVLNAGELDWVIGKHLAAVKMYGALIDWSKVLPIAYIICNSACAAARMTKSRGPSLPDLLGYLMLSEELFRFSVVYLEYSGVYGCPEWVRATVKDRKTARIYYGGGITQSQQAQEMLALADTIVIGNILYDDPSRLREILELLVD